MTRIPKKGTYCWDDQSSCGTSNSHISSRVDCGRPSVAVKVRWDQPHRDPVEVCGPQYLGLTERGWEVEKEEISVE